VAFDALQSLSDAEKRAGALLFLLRLPNQFLFEIECTKETGIRDG